MIIYASGYFHTDADPRTLEQAWTKYMRLTYPLNKLQGEHEQCEHFGDSAEQRAYAMTYADKQWTGPSQTLTHVDWAYTPAEIAATNAAAASANAASAAAGPQLGANQTYALCFSDPSAPVVYFSEVLAGTQAPTGRNGGAQRAADAEIAGPFQAFLQKQYGANNPVSCTVAFLPTAAGLKAAQDRKQSMEDTARQNKAKVVETGWKQ
jgi:hypothetical protein